MPSKRPEIATGQLFFQKGETVSRNVVWKVVRIFPITTSRRLWRATCVSSNGEQRTLSVVDGRIVRNGQMLEPMTGRCLQCGCTANRACLGGCWWAAPDLCDTHTVGRAA